MCRRRFHGVERQLERRRGETRIVVSSGSRTHEARSGPWLTEGTTNTTHANGIGREPDPARRTRISQAHPTRPPARTATESTTMDSNVQIVSHVCTVCADVQLAAASITNRGVHVHTRAPVILAWRVLRGARRHTSGKGGAIQSHTRGKGGGPRLRGGRRHSHGKGGTQPHPRERWGTSTEGRDATPKAKAMGEVGDLDESTALTWQLTGFA